MLNPKAYLNPKLFAAEIEQEALRDGFGRGLLVAGSQNQRVVAIGADTSESTRLNLFAEQFPQRFFNVGVAEQNLVTVASGLAVMGKIPVVSTYATFSPGRNWEQIRTTICINDANVKIAGAHAGVSVGPDGATHQALEDIAIMRVLPNIKVVVPADGLETERAIQALIQVKGPAYIRLSREKFPIITTAQTPFTLDRAQIFRLGKNVTIIAAGALVYEALVAAERLAKAGVEAEVINCAVIKPLDQETLLASIHKTGAVVTAEEHQIIGGLGSAVAELVTENLPVPMERVGVKDHFGQSGTPAELFEHFGLKSANIIKAVKRVMDRK